MASPDPPFFPILWWWGPTIWDLLFCVLPVRSVKPNHRYHAASRRYHTVLPALIAVAVASIVAVRAPGGGVAVSG